VEGTIYLVNPVNKRVYTHNPERPLYVGDLQKVEHPEEKIVTIRFRPDLKDVMEAELKKM
jgi:hypothetical protein